MSLVSHYSARRGDMLVVWENSDTVAVFPLESAWRSFLRMLVLA